jgi:hypothetical protein
MYHNLPLSNQDVGDIGRAFNKVWENRGDIVNAREELK